MKKLVALILCKEAADMKKIIAILLCLVMIFALCGCSASRIPWGVTRIPWGTTRAFQQVFQFPISTDVEVNVQFPISVNGVSGAIAP